MDTRGEFRIQIEEAVVHAGIDNFHRRLVYGVDVTATRASVILTINRDKKREISLAVSSKDRKYRADIMAAQIVADIISKGNTTKQISFPDEQVDTMQDFSTPRMFLSKNRHSSTTSEDLSERLILSIYHAALTVIPRAQRYIPDIMFDVCRMHGTMFTNTMDDRYQSIHKKTYYQVLV